MILWPNLYAHFVTIYGYDGSNGVDYVLVADPLNPKYMYTYYDLVNNYAQSGGKWHESYFTVGHIPVTTEMAAMNRSFTLPIKKIDATGERKNAIIRSTKVPVKNARLHAHDISYIVFEDLLKEDLTYKKTGFRILKRGKKTYLADFSDVEHQLIGLTDDADYIALYQKKWKQVIEQIRHIKKKYTVEVLQVPQLGVECFKLEFTAGSNVQFLPIRNSFLFDQDRFYKFDELQHILTSAAKEKVRYFLEKN